MATQTIPSGMESQEVNQSNRLIRHSMLLYGVLAYGLSWGIGLGAITAIEKGSLDPDGAVVSVLGWIAAASPAIAAFIVLAATGGRPAVADWIRKIVKWRVGLHWYFFALVGMPAIIMSGYSIIYGAPIFQLLLQKWTSVVPILIPAVAFAVFEAGLAEEPGWRGFALPRMQARHGPIFGSLLLGVFWAMWHLPNAFGPAGISFFALQFVAVMLYTFVHTWVYNQTRGSVLISILLHATVNVTAGFIAYLVGATDPAFRYQTYTAGLISTAIFVLAICLLTRGRLGYRAEQTEVS